MALMNRREAGKLVLGGCVAAGLAKPELFGAAKIDSVVRGVQIGAQAYSFRDRPMDQAIDAFREVGLSECELSDILFQKALTRGPDVNQWRTDTPMSYFQEIRKKYDTIGVSISANGYNMPPKLTDEMIERGFQMTRAMGLARITTTTTVSMVPRIDRFAQKYRIPVGYHNHDRTSDPEAFASKTSILDAIKGASPYARINLDIGHFTAANEDPVAFIREHHAKIVTLHIKDRKKNHGPNLPFGQGDTPIVEVLRLLRDNHWKIPANIEYEYGNFALGLDAITEVKKCYAYCRQALES